MMTVIAFIAGLVPLVVAHGPGADSMYAVGLPVIWGMIAASILGVLLIPMLYVVFQRMREWKLFGKAKPPKGGEAVAEPVPPAH